ATGSGKNFTVNYKGTFGYHDQRTLGEEEFRNFEFLNDWFQTGAIVKNSVSLSGGTDKMRMYLSLDRNNEENHTPRNEFKQTNLRANVDYFISPQFNLKASSQFTDTEIDLPSRSRGGDEFGFLVFQRYPYDTQRNLSNTRPSFWDSRSDESFINSYTGSVTAEFAPFVESDSPLKNLSGRLTFGIDDRDNRIIFTQNPTTREVQGRDRDGLRRIAQRNSQTVTYNGDLSYKYDLGSSIQATSTIGAQLFDERERIVITEKEQFATRLITDISVGAEAGQIEETNNHFRSAGIFAEQTFSMNDTYFATLMVRQDYASVLGALTSSIAYPAAKLAVRLDRFDWTPSFFSFLKFRTAYGETGVLPGRLDGIGLLWEAQESQFGVGAGISSIGNPALEPERVKEWEIGFEAEVANYAMDFTYYRQNTTDSIVPRENVPSSGLTSDNPPFNIGEIEGSGWEAQLHANFAGKALGGWRTNFTLTTSFQKNKVTDMGGANEIRQGPGGGRQVYKEGMPKGSFFNPATLGALFSDGTNVDDIEFSPTQGEVVAAGVIYGFDDTPGPVLLGDADPDYIGSFSTNLTAGGFTLYGLLSWKTGFSLYNEQRVDMIFNGTDNPDWLNGDGTNVLDWDQWTQQLGFGDTGTGLAALTPGTPEYERVANLWAATSPFFDANSIQPGDFLKLRELSLSYSFDKFLRNSSFFSNIQGLRIGIVGTNLKNWLKRDPSTDTVTTEDGTEFTRHVGGFTGVDSEINSLGFDAGPQSAMQSGTIPPSRTVSFFINLTF
ncbi:MAG: TonB-dependent receptor, partial [Verrucomicrobia bacterium]|nr:TonB-dependent receptor [Verrucomicrobiota bacterium]